MWEIPTEITFEMYAEKDVTLPRFTGYISRGLLLHMLGRVDPRTAQRLHEPQTMKPYSVTPLRFGSKARSPDGYVLDPAHPCHVGFRFLEDAHVRSLIDYFAEEARVTVFDTTFQVVSLSLNSKSYAELEAEAEPLEAFWLVFRTPTYLSRMGSPYHCLLPEPVRVFPSLMRLWSEYSTSRRFGREEHLAYKEWLARHVGVAEYELRTMLAQMGRKKATGFLGWVTYEMDVQDEWNRVTATLARFAEYSNIGGNRTGGFGVTRLFSKMGVRGGLGGCS